MGMDAFADSQAIFQQLAQVQCAGPAGVKTIIENHDAWANTETIEGALNRSPVARIENSVRDVRILSQRLRLAQLAVVLPSPYSSAI